jgi:hypothetical protein
MKKKFASGEIDYVNLNDKYPDKGLLTLHFVMLMLIA